jgi:dTDP-4-dehydrorhamnose reductase
VPLSLAITYFTIPFTTLKSEEEESAFMADKLTDIIDAMKAALMNRTSKECLSILQEIYTKSILREGISFNMQNFVNKAIICITKANKISNFFMHTTAQEVTDQLWATSTDAPKYEFKQEEFEECNASSNEDEDDEEDEMDDISEKQGKFINVN